jgi:hypothetical protein
MNVYDPRVDVTGAYVVIPMLIGVFFLKTQDQMAPTSGSIPMERKSNLAW